MLFYTAGELTTRELKADGVQYTQYAGQGLYTNLCGAGCREKIAEYWTPHLDGKRSLEECLSALVASFKRRASPEPRAALSLSRPAR